MSNRGAAPAGLPGTAVHGEVPGRPFTAEDLVRIPRVGPPAPAPGGDRCVVPVTTARPGAAAVTRLWLVPGDGGTPRPITSPDAVCAAPEWSPDGGRLAFTRKPADVEDAVPQLHVLRLDGGEAERVTDLPLGVLDARWRPDGSGLVIAAKLLRDHPTVEGTAAELKRRRQDPVKAHATEDRLYRFWDQWLTGGEVPHLLLLDPSTGAGRDLAPDVVGWFDFMEPRGQFDLAPDGTEAAFAALAFDEALGEVVSRVYRVGLDDGEIECLTADAPADAVRPRYSPDGAAIVYGRRQELHFYADRARLYRFDRRTGTHAPWCEHWDRGPRDWEFAPDGTLLLLADDGARTNLYALAADAREPRRIAGGGTYGAPRPAAGGAAFCTRQSLQQPPEVHRCPLDGGEPARLTRFTEEAMAGLALGAVREIEVSGAEGEPVQTFVVLPPRHDAAAPAPFVNLLHGGPHGMSADAFSLRWNPHVMAARGHVVALPNFQGSVSWGTDYARRIQGAWGDRPFRDVMAVTDAMVESGLADERRMAAAGGSYGGYLVAWIGGHTDRFRCLVNHAGVYDPLAMYASDWTRGRGRSFGGEAWDGLEAIDRCNPARFAAGMRTPMLVVHGERDFRVPAAQGLACYGVLKARGVPARLLYFPDENHWVLKPHNSVRWYAEVLDWLDRWLCADAEAGRRP